MNQRNLQWEKKRADEKELSALVFKVIEKYEADGTIEMFVTSKEQGEFFVKAIEAISKVKLQSKITGKKKNWKVTWERN